MSTLTIRPSISGADCRALTFTERSASAAKIFADIADLVKLNEPTGQLDDDILVGDLLRFLDAPDVDRARDLRLWKDNSVKLIGFCQLLMPKHNDEIEGGGGGGGRPARRDARE